MLKVTPVALLMFFILLASPRCPAQTKRPHQKHTAATPAAKPSPVSMKYMAGSKPHVSLTWTWHGLWENHTFRCKTPGGKVSVRFLPYRDSKRPPTHDAEITHPFTDMPVVIRSPKALPVLVEVGDGPGSVSPSYVQVNGRATTFANGRVWLKGGRTVLLVAYPDAE